MGDESRGIKFFPEYFEPSTSGADQEHSQTTLSDLRTSIHPRSDNLWWVHRKLQSASYMLNLFSLRGLSWGSGTDNQEKVVLTAAELSSLRSDITDLEEREAHLKARLEHLDEILRSARLSGYLYIRTRWATLPGEPPPIDDTEVDDWLPRFLVLYGPRIYLYLSSTDLSPQDSTLLSDVVDVGSLPNLKREDEETRYCFYILTRHGPRYECASASKMQVDSWLAALKKHCSFGSGH